MDLACNALSYRTLWQRARTSASTDPSRKSAMPWSPPPAAPANAPLSLGIDIGGTFTDIVVIDPSNGNAVIWKESTTPDDPARGTMLGLWKLVERSGIALERIGIHDVRVLPPRPQIEIAMLPHQGVDWAWCMIVETGLPYLDFSIDRGNKIAGLNQVGNQTTKCRAVDHAPTLGAKKDHATSAALGLRSAWSRSRARRRDQRRRNWLPKSWRGTFSKISC